MDTAAGAPDVVRQLVRQIVEAFFMYPHFVAGVLSVGLAAVIVAGFWAMRGSIEGVRGARLALKAQQLRAQKDHRALILLAHVDGPGGAQLRLELAKAIEEHFSQFAFHAPVQIETLPVHLPIVSETASITRRRRVAGMVVDVLERSGGDVILWGRRAGIGGKVEMRAATPPQANVMEEITGFNFRWSSGKGLGEMSKLIAYLCARRARPVLNKPQDYKPEKLQPIVEALESIANDPPNSLSENMRLEVLSDFASGALSLGERGGEGGWLQKALNARQQYLESVDRTADAAAWGRAQQEVGRALAALGEREADRAKLEEAVSILQTSIDALRATESLQSAEVAMRALSRAQQSLAARKRIGLRWPV